jgi:hypothetical protein
MNDQHVKEEKNNKNNVVDTAPQSVPSGQSGNASDNKEEKSLSSHVPTEAQLPRASSWLAYMWWLIDS